MRSYKKAKFKSSVKDKNLELIWNLLFKGQEIK